MERKEETKIQPNKTPQALPIKSVNCSTVKSTINSCITFHRPFDLKQNSETFQNLIQQNKRKLNTYENYVVA